MFKKLAPALLFAGVTMAYMASAGASNHQITICHATGNPGHYSMPNPTKQQIADDHGHRTGQAAPHQLGARQLRQVGGAGGRHRCDP